MPGQRKRLTRAESQQRTREEILDAAEKLFLEHGLHGTTMSKIAAAAGRTDGAVYGNFGSKENLCAEVLVRSYANAFALMVPRFAELSDSFDRQVDAVGEWWSDLSGNEDVISLFAEYGLAVRKDEEQRETNAGHIAMFRNMLGAILLTGIPDEVSAERREAALTAILAMAGGLALSRILGVTDGDQVTELLAHTLRLWVADLERDIDA